MKITAITESSLPFRAEGMAACAAARAGSVLMKLPGIPGEFNVEFIGTGTATVPISVNNLFANNDAQDTINITWYQNKFVGKHWLLGDFKIILNENATSSGTIETKKNNNEVMNRNFFFFDFQFKRFPFLNMANVTPIVNSGKITSIPPIGSVLNIEKANDNLFKFNTGLSRIKNNTNSSTRTIQFNQCDIIVFPEQNVSLHLIEMIRLDINTYSVTVEIENITDVEATFAHFSVIHFAGITIDNDYGFVLLNPKSAKKITYRVTSTISSRVIELPFFAALYHPKELNGSKSLAISFEF